MRVMRVSRLVMAAAAAFIGGAGASAGEAQTRLVLPEGSVIMVRTNSALQSATAAQGQTFETIVTDTVRVNNFTVIPAGSRIRGVVTFAQRADRQNSGVIEVGFDRLILADGSTYPLAGRLTSTDAAERRQIETDPDARVVLVGGRGGIGAAIAGAGSQNNPASGILGALGSLLSEGRDVQVPAGTPLAVQLEQGLVLNARGTARPPRRVYALHRRRSDPRGPAGAGAAELLSGNDQRAAGRADTARIVRVPDRPGHHRHRQPGRQDRSGPRPYGDFGCPGAFG